MYRVHFPGRATLNFDYRNTRRPRPSSMLTLKVRIQQAHLDLTGNARVVLLLMNTLLPFRTPMP